MKCIDVAKSLGTVVFHRSGGVLCAAEHAVEAADQRIEVLGLKFVEAAKVGHHVLANGALLGAVGLDELQIAATARLGDTRVHVATLARRSIFINSQIE